MEYSFIASLSFNFPETLNNAKERLRVNFGRGDVCQSLALVSGTIGLIYKEHPLSDRSGVAGKLLKTHRVAEVSIS